MFRLRTGSPRLCLGAALLSLSLLALLSPPVADAGESSRDAALVAKIRQIRLSKVEMENQNLREVVAYLRTITGINFHVRLRALEQAGIDPEDVSVTLTLNDISLKTFLDLALGQHELAWKVKDNVVFITTKKDAQGKPFTRLYGIAHITWTKRDFIAPEISLPNANGDYDEYEPEVEVEDDALNNGDAVADLLKQMLDPEGWDENDDWSISATDTYLLIRAPAKIHAQVHQTLAKIASMK